VSSEVPRGAPPPEGLIVKRSQREAARARNEQFAQRRAQERSADDPAKRDAAVQAALARADVSDTARLDRLLADLDAERVSGRPVRRSAGLAQSASAPSSGAALPPDPLFREVPDARRLPEFLALVRKVAKEAPRLLDASFLGALGWISTLPLVRPIEGWRPRGKARDTIFRSLVDHVLARYPAPAVLWDAFFSEQASSLTPLVGHVVAGGSLHEYVKEAFPVPLTRRMCHELLATPASYRFMHAVRRVQVRAAGGDARFLQAWMGTRPARTLGTREEEGFWATVVEWFAKMVMLDPHDVGPIADHLEYRRRQDPKFTMKGRSALAVLRDVRAWHGALAEERTTVGPAFRTSGFREATYDDLARRAPNGDIIKERWQVEEVLTRKALADEGRRMGHCVYSYASRIDQQQVSIWTVTMRDGLGETGRWAMLTVEVRNGSRQVVQARGRSNRAATPRETAVLSRWASLNGLQLALGV